MTKFPAYAQMKNPNEAILRLGSTVSPSSWVSGRRTPLYIPFQASPAPDVFECAIDVVAVWALVEVDSCDRLVVSNLDRPVRRWSSGRWRRLVKVSREVRVNIMSAEGQDAPSKRSFVRSSIVWKLTLFVGVLVTINCGVLIGVAYIATSRILRNQINERLSTVASDRQEMLAYMLNSQEERAAQLAKQVRIHRLFAQRAEGTISPDRFRVETEAMLANARANTTGFLAFWVEDIAGQVLASSGPLDLVAGYSRLERSEERPDGSLIVPPRRVGSAFGFVFSSVVRGWDGQALGTVLLLSDFGPMAKFLMDPNGLEETGEVLVGVAEGETIRLILPSRRLSPVSEIPASQFPVMSDAIAGRFGCKQTIDYHGNDVVAAFRPVGFGFTGWGLIAKIDTAEAYRPVDRLRWLLLGLGGAALVLGLGASNAIARRFARPIRKLARTSSAVAAGDLNVRSEVTGSDEIGALSTAFNRMTEDLARSYGTLERRISERTRELEAVRDLLDAFFRISTSQLDPDNIDKTYDSVLRFCSQLGYDLAMISLADRDAGVIRAAACLGSHDRRRRANGAAPGRRRHSGRRRARGSRARRA